VFACVLAAFGLISILAAPAFPETSGSASAQTLIVYLNAGSNGAASTLLHMRREAEKLMRSAGYQLEWRETRNSRGQETVPDLVFLDLAGTCSLPGTPAGTSVPEELTPRLASTAVTDGVVLPFSRIDCAALTALTGPMLLREAPGQRPFYYGRAMGRLMAHELYHVLAQTRDHATAGVGKPCFTAHDLISDRFDFESVALARFRKPAAETAGDFTLPATRR
jgi:hypothetical protein